MVESNYQKFDSIRFDRSPRADAVTTRKCRYYDAINRNPEGKSRKQIADDCGISEGTGRYWEK
jgi:hypothetical protein